MSEAQPTRAQLLEQQPRNELYAHSSFWCLALVHVAWAMRNVGAKGSFSFWFVYFGRRPVKDFGGVHHRFAECRMGVNRFGNVAYDATHFDCQGCFGN